MVVLVDLPQCIAYFQVLLIVVSPVLLGAGHWNTTVRAFEVDMGRCQVPMGLVVGVVAAGILPHESRSFPDLGNGRVGERVEEVIGFQNSFLLGLGGCGRTGSKGKARREALRNGGWSRLGDIAIDGSSWRGAFAMDGALLLLSL